MYPSTNFIIEDRSYIEDLQISEQYPSPLFAQFFTSDKGPEEMGEYFGDEFKIFGAPNFARHGQPLLQAQRLINNGSRVLAKRVVAEDATLANAVVLASVKPISVHKKNENGKPLYIDSEGQETVEVTDTPVMVNTCSIRYDIQPIEGNRNDIEDLKKEALKLRGAATTGEEVYPICVVADNGRGLSAKKFNITANINGSRNKEYLSYILTVFENSDIIESTVFTLDPNTNSATSNLSLTSVSKTYLKEVRAFSFDDVMVEFLDAIKTATGIENINNIDVLFGKDKKAKGLSQFLINTELDEEGNEVHVGTDLNSPIGIALEAGSNGAFGNSPINATEAYAAGLEKAFNGEFTDDIYDIDNILLDGIIDANYPESVKAAIEKLVNFRQDAFFFRDLGTDRIFTGEDIVNKAEQAAKSRYIGIYGNCYDVIDEYSKKQITVTTGYSLAARLPQHFADNRHSPVAGFLHGFVFDEIIEGTVNFLPKNLPDFDQKAQLFDAHVNFISYLNKIPTLESEYTSQVDHTGFSYINNTLAVQRIVKEIRVHCPKSRYSFMEEEDLIKYEEDVQAILNKYASNFSLLKMEYAADPTYEQNMVYYAILRVRFKKFVQAEVFKIIAISGDDVVSAI